MKGYTIFMKKIVCYGDSNTFGFNPKTLGRYDNSLLWTNILSKKLQDTCEVYNEGQNGRTTAFDRSDNEEANGLDSLIPILKKYRTVDLLIFMLGTNDCSCELDLSIDDIKNGMEKLIITSRNYLKESQGYIPKILIIVPAKILSNYKGTLFESQINDETLVKTKSLGKPYKELADKYDCLYLDCTNEIEVTTIDCEHLTENGHNKLAELIYNKIKNVI